LGFSCGTVTPACPELRRDCALRSPWERRPPDRRVCPRHGVCAWVLGFSPFCEPVSPRRPRHHSRHTNNCHPDRSGPIFSFAPPVGASGRAVEGSRQDRLLGLSSLCEPPRSQRRRLPRPGRGVIFILQNNEQIRLSSRPEARAVCGPQWRDRGTIRLVRTQPSLPCPASRGERGLANQTATQFK
jgi:hypothetical protein